MKIERSVPKAGYRTWTSDELTLLAELADQGMSWLQIATRLGRTHRSVRNMVLRKGIQSKLPQPEPKAPPPPPEPPVSLARPRRFRGAGFTFSAPELPFSTDLAEMRAWLDLAAERGPYTAADDLELCERLFRGEPRDETLKIIARRHGLTAQDVVQRFALLTSPIRNDRNIPTTDGIARLLTLLRERTPA